MAGLVGTAQFIGSVPRKQQKFVTSGEIYRIYYPCEEIAREGHETRSREAVDRIAAEFPCCEIKNNSGTIAVIGELAPMDRFAMGFSPKMPVFETWYL